MFLQKIYFPTPSTKRGSFPCKNPRKHSSQKIHSKGISCFGLVTFSLHFLIPSKPSNTSVHSFDSVKEKINIDSKFFI